MLDHSLSLQDVIDKSGGRNGTWPALCQDLFASLYKTDPQFNDEATVEKPFLVNREIVKRFLENRETQAMREYTVLDELEAGFATLASARQLQKEVQENEDLQKAMQNAMAALGGMNGAGGPGQSQAGQQGGNNGGNGQPGQQPGDQPGQGQGNRGKGQPAPQPGDPASAQAAKDALDEVASDLRYALTQAAKAGKEAAKDVADVLAGWGVGAGDLRTVPIEERMQLVERLKEARLRKLSDLVGRMRNLASAKYKAKTIHGKDEIHSITVGRDLAHVLPGELASLADPARQLDFYRRFSEGKLLQYELKGKERVGRGDLVVCIDTSGSMNQPERLDMAVAIGVGLLETALKQHRAAHVLFFDTTIQQEFTFKRKDSDYAQKLLRLASVQAVGGGTNFERPLRRAITLIESEFKAADIVFITDGECRVSDAFMPTFKAARERLDFRTWGVLVGYSAYDRLPWATRVWEAKQLTDEVAADLFEEVATNGN
jgi:uncharacterized protein with von Willebrand factor type A (vWA) domain